MHGLMRYHESGLQLSVQLLDSCSRIKLRRHDLLPVMPA